MDIQKRMLKFRKQMLRAMVVAALLVVAMLAVQQQVRVNPLFYLRSNVAQVALSYFVVALLCWGVDAGFEAYFHEYILRLSQKIKLGIILLVAVGFTTVAFYHDWKYDGPPMQTKEPFLTDFIKSWPVVAIYVAVISTIEIVVYLFLKLIVGELARLYKALRKSSIHP